MEKIKPIQNIVLHALLGELQMTTYKADLVSRVTQGRTISSKELSVEEADQLINDLKAEKEVRVKPMRGKVIHYLCLCGMVDVEGNPDFGRINNFIKGIGSNNPKGKSLLQLSIDETRKVLNQVQAMYTNTLKKKPA